MTVAEIQTEILARLGPGARTTASQLLPSIDEGTLRIYNKLVNAGHQSLFYGTASFATIDGRSEYAVTDGVPNDIKKILKVETKYDGQTDRVKAHKITLENVDQMDKITTTDKSRERPGYYKMGNGALTVIGFIPEHDSAISNGNKLWYFKKPTKITVSTQTPIVPEDSHYLIVQFGLAVAQLTEDEDANTHLQFLRRFDQDVLEYIDTELPGSDEPIFTQDAADEGEDYPL